MIIGDLITGNFMERPNRFTVLFNTDDKTKKAHLRDPGRLKELLIPGIPLLLRPAQNTAKRKTKYDVIAVLNRDIWVLINSGFHSDIALNLSNQDWWMNLKGIMLKKENIFLEKAVLTFYFLSMKMN